MFGEPGFCTKAGTASFVDNGGKQSLCTWSVGLLILSKKAIIALETPQIVTL